MEKYKDNLNNFLIIFMVSSFLFYIINISFPFYSTVILCIFVLLLINCSLQKNIRLYIQLVYTFYANFLALILVKKVVHETLHWSIGNGFVCIFLNLCVLALIVHIVYYSRKQKRIKRDTKELFKNRMFDLDRIRYYLDKVSAVGIDGSWGSGKTFLIQSLEEEKQYYFINIALLSSNLDEIQIALMKGMEKILNEEKIFSMHAGKIKQILSTNKFLAVIQRLLGRGALSYTEELEGLKEEVALLDKKIVIVYEDIDRITDINIIKKIFSISENLVNRNIKIIYQYDQNNFDEMHLTRKFIEKYIPFVVNLSELSFMEMVQMELKELHVPEELISIKDFMYLERNISADYTLEKKLNLQIEMSVDFVYLPVREIKNMLIELLIILESEEKYREKVAKKTIISFFVLKHLLREPYEKLSIKKGLLDTFTFSDQEKIFTLSEIVEQKHLYEKKKEGLSPEKIKEIFERKENRDNYFIICLFECKIWVEDEDTPEAQRRKQIIQEENELKNRIVWNLLCNAKSEYTDAEAVTQRLIDSMLKHPEEEQKSLWNNFLKEIDSNIWEKDNKSIFYFGTPWFLRIFQAFRITNRSEEEWVRLIQLYFNVSDIKEITPELVKIYCYCDLKSNRVYLSLLKMFNMMEINGNLNANEDYQFVLFYYMRALSSLGYINTFEVWMLQTVKGKPLELEAVNCGLDILEKDLKQLQEKIPERADFIKEDINIIQNFITKNRQLIATEDPYGIKEKPRRGSSWSSHFIHEGEMKRLQELKDSPDFWDNVKESYQEGKICAAEVSRL